MTTILFCKLIKIDYRDNFIATSNSIWICTTKIHLDIYLFRCNDLTVQIDKRLPFHIIEMVQTEDGADSALICFRINTKSLPLMYI